MQTPVYSPKKTLEYMHLSITPEKLNFCHTQLFIINKVKRTLKPDSEGGALLARKEKRWIDEREAQQFEYQKEIKNELNTNLIFFQGTCHYKEECSFLPSNDSFLQLARLGSRLSLSFILVGVCCAIVALVLAGDGYFTSGSFSKHWTIEKFLAIASGFCFIAAYCTNLTFLFLMRNHAKAEALDDTNNECSSLHPKDSAEGIDYYNSASLASQHVRDDNDSVSFVEIDLKKSQ